MAVWQNFFNIFIKVLFFDFCKTLDCLREIDDQWVSSEKLELLTDVSGVELAGILQRKWFQGRWPSSWLNLNIAINELYPIVLALALWSHDLKDKRLLCDDESVVQYSRART